MPSSQARVPLTQLCERQLASSTPSEHWSSPSHTLDSGMQRPSEQRNSDSLHGLDVPPHRGSVSSEESGQSDSLQRLDDDRDMKMPRLTSRTSTEVVFDVHSSHSGTRRCRRSADIQMEFRQCLKIVVSIDCHTRCSPCGQSGAPLHMAHCNEKSQLLPPLCYSC